MSRFIESIRWENGQFHLLEYHAQRMARTMRDVLDHDVGDAYMLEVLKNRLKEIKELKISDDLSKVRILYDLKIEKIEVNPYLRRLSQSLKVVHSDDISYEHKTLKRDMLDALFDQRGKADDVLIVKNGFVTDTYYHNILFYDGAHWVTPSHPLLRGVQRQYLIDQGTVKEQEVKIGDVKKFHAYKKINALNPFEAAPIHLIQTIC